MWRSLWAAAAALCWCGAAQAETLELTCSLDVISLTRSAVQTSADEPRAMQTQTLSFDLDAAVMNQTSTSPPPGPIIVTAERILMIGGSLVEEEPGGADVITLVMEVDRRSGAWTMVATNTLESRASAPIQAIMGRGQCATASGATSF